MFALIGLFFLIIKIAILASVYALIIVLTLFIISKNTEIARIRKLMEYKFLTWLASGFLCSVFLFWYAFSFWGYAGLGDSFCIPVSNGYTVNSIDAQETSYFEPDKGENSSRQAFIKNFAIKDHKICAEFLGFNSDANEGCFIVFDTEEEKIYEFHTSGEYSDFASKNSLPQKQEFKSFGANYSEYWGGNRNWFLP